MFDDCLIMAGGSGTRLWPASNSRLAKQFLPVSGKETFFSTSVKRALAVTDKQGTVLIIAGKKHIPHVINNLANLNLSEKKRLLVIVEPAAKNTAPAIACAVAYSLLTGSNRKMLVLTSDHIINPLSAFVNDAALAAAAIASDRLAVFGIRPTRPETGYGYIQTGRSNAGICDVLAFHEKPDVQTAKRFTSGKHFFWNSGMFAFSSEFMASEFRRLVPDVFVPFEKLKKIKPASFTVSRGIRVINSWPGLKNAYMKTKTISFDYAVAEKCSKTIMVPAGFNWIDIGNWEDYAQLCSGSINDVFAVNAETCHVDSDIPVALAGVEDLIIIIRSGKNGSPAAALITRKGHTQKVRDVVEQIKNAGKADIL
jgi:mannose-1-phosphate guanylyltransferase/mannose-6-phosphate isomerase